MIDLRFSTPEDRKKFDCARCPQNVKAMRRCAEDGYDNLTKPLDVGQGSLSYSFCPGKATWSQEAAEIYQQCHLTMECGILPEAGDFEDQSEAFCLTLPAFVERWRERGYLRVWGDVHTFLGFLIKSFVGK